MRFIVGWWLYEPSAVYTIYTSVMVIRIVIMVKMRKAVVGIFFYIPLLNPLWTGNASMTSSKNPSSNVTSHQVQHFVECDFSSNLTFRRMRLLMKYNISSNVTSYQIQHFVECDFLSNTTFHLMLLLIKYISSNATSHQNYVKRQFI